MVNEAVEVLIAVPLTNVVTVIEYVPGHATVGIVNGNDTVFDVLAGNVNAGVV